MKLSLRQKRNLQAFCYGFFGGIMILNSKFLFDNYIVNGRNIDYNPQPNTRQIRYNEKYPIIETFEPLYENVSNINMRDFTDCKGRTFSGELNGLGRSWGVHHIESCLPCKKVIGDIFREVLEENKTK